MRGRGASLRISVAAITAILLFSLAGRLTLGREIRVTTADELLLAVAGLVATEALHSAGATPEHGDIIILAPGVYDIDSRGIKIAQSRMVIKAEEGPLRTIITGTGTILKVSGDNVMVEGLTIAGGQVGVEVLEASRVKVLANIFRDNDVALALDKVRDAHISGNLISRNVIGIAIEDSSSVMVLSNAIRHNGVGIRVGRNNHSIRVTENNIARNSEFGIDAREATETVDARCNWWGCPSGPYHPTRNPNSCGDRVSDNVDFVCDRPPLPPVRIKRPITCPTTADTRIAWTCTVEVENTGTKEASVEEITLIVQRDWTVIGTKSIIVNRTIKPAETTIITFDYKFTESGDYAIELIVNGDSETIRVHVTPVFLTIEQVVAQKSGNPTIIEDLDIIWAVELWVEDTIIPGTDGLKIDDAKILELVGMWIEGTPVPQASARAAQQPQKKGFNFCEWLLSLFHH